MLAHGPVSPRELWSGQADILRTYDERCFCGVMCLVRRPGVFERSLARKPDCAPTRAVWMAVVKNRRPGVSRWHDAAPDYGVQDGILGLTDRSCAK